MDKEKDTEKIERWKIVAETILKKDIPDFVKDVDENIYFGYIVLNGDDNLVLDCFGPEQRRGEKPKLYWWLITEFQEYKKKEENE
jgi:hypothetical protein